MIQMTGNTNHTSIITLNVWPIGLKRKIQQFDNARDSPYRKRCPQPKGERMGKNIPCTWTQQKPRISILISDKVDIKPKLVRRDKEGHFILLMGSINQQDITIINIYAQKSGSSMYIKQILLNSRNQIEYKTIILGDFNIPLSLLDISFKQKLNKETTDLNNTII